MPIFQTGNETVLLGVELNNYCSLSCTHCLRNLKGSPENFPPKLLRKILKEAKQFGSKIVGFTGGEPTLHPKLDEILDIVDEEGYRCYFVTNASRFEIISKKLVSRKDIVAGISFSIDGAVEATHDFIRGKGSFRQVMTAVANCHGEKIPFNLQMCVNAKNKHEIAQIATMAAQLGVEDLFYALPIPTPELVKNNLLLSPDECRKVEDEVNKLKRQFNFDIFMAVGYFVENPLFLCRAQGMSALNFDFSGNLTLCCQLSNYRNSKSKIDIIAGMADSSLLNAIIKLRDHVNRFAKEKTRVIQSGSMKKIDYFPCFYCTKWHGKLDWLKEMNSNPWN